MKTQITLPANLNNLKVTCPYCGQESLLKDWQFWVEPLAKIQEGNLEIVYIYSSAKCPVCKAMVDIWENEEVSIDNAEELKKIIENYSIESVDILIQCPACKKWNDFYEWKFEGFAKNLNVELLNDSEVSINGKIQEVFVTKAICERCDYEVRLDNVKVNVPMGDKDIEELFNSIKEAIEKNEEQE